MHTRIGWPKRVAFGLAAALLVGAFAPAANAQSQLNVRSVGEIFVDASGKASGQNVAAAITEATGVLEGFTALALGTEVFGAVEIDGFAQAEKIQGVGSSAILLRGSNAVVSVYDNINSEFRVQATAPTEVRYSLGPDVFASLDGPHMASLHDERGAYVGAIVLAGQSGAAASSDRLAAVDGAISAKLGPGAQSIYISRPVYVDSPSYNAAVVDSLAKGYLSSKIVTEFDGSAEAASAVDYLSNVRAATAAADYSLETTVESRAEQSTILAYDLAYESLPAASASDVQMYANGELAARADAPGDVQQYAAAGLASYYAIVENGRTQILASTPSFESSSSHELTFTASAEASTASAARADSEARQDARATGDYQLHANGKLTGLFTTGLLSADEAAVFDYTSLASRTEIFSAIRLDGGAAGASNSDNAVTLAGPNADLTLFDDVYTTMIVDSKAKASAAFDLGQDVRAYSVSDDVIRLEGPNGYAGALILANANGASSFSRPDAGSIVARMESGSQLVFRSQPAGDAHASEDAVADAIASGQVGAQLLAGFQSSAITTSNVDYSPNVDTSFASAARGAYKIDYTTDSSVAKSFVFDTRGTALAAKQASDISVLVNGQAATAVSTPQAVFSAAGGAKYFVDTTVLGQTRVLVNTASALHAKSQVEIKSRIDQEARASANKDAFGAFKMFYDGTAIGDFVSLKSQSDAGVVSDFTMMSTGQTIFSSIQAGHSAFLTSGAEGTPTIQLENREAEMEFTDTTSAYMNIVAKQATDVNFNLAPDVRAEQRSASVVELATAQGEALGSLIITDVEGRAAATSSFEQRSSSQLNAALDKSAQVIFRTHVGIEAELSEAQRTMINHAIAGGKVAGQVLVQSQAALAASAHAQAQAQARAQMNAKSSLESSSQTAFDGASAAVSAIESAGRITTAVTASYYNDVQMITAATQSRVDITVSSATSVGKTMIVSLDKATLPAMSTGDAEILVDGRAATQASSYADILNPADDAGAYEYFVLAGEAGTQVLVSMPHFSTHTVTLKERDAASPPLFMFATIFLGALVAVETVMLVRRRAA